MCDSSSVWATGVAETLVAATIVAGPRRERTTGAAGGGALTTTRPDPARAGDDALLRALEHLVLAADDVDKAVQTLTSRAARMRAARLEGADWREIVEAEERPLIAEMLTDTISRFEHAGTRFRQAKARALHEEGMTMEQIAELFGVTRQRISVLLRGSSQNAGR